MSTDISVQVIGPNSVPTGMRFETSKDSYCDGFPNVPEPEWMKREAKRFLEARVALDVTVAIEAINLYQD
jgi:hypothetical protein